MQAMILAAGRGERLRPLTDKVPKPLVPVLGQPLIVYHIKKLAAIGISKIVINHAWLGESLITALGDGSRWGVELSYSAEQTALDTGGGIKKALPLLGHSPFLVINGDVFIDAMPDIPVLEQGQMAHLWLTDNPVHHPQGDFVLNQKSVSLEGNNTMTFTGIGLYRPQLFESVKANTFGLGGLLRSTIEQGPRGIVGGSHLPGLWCDVGTVSRLKELEQRLSV